MDASERLAPAVADSAARDPLTGLEPSDAVEVGEDARSSAFNESAERIRSIARTLPGGADEDIQNDLGLILKLLSAYQARASDASAIANLEIAVNALVQDPPNHVLAVRLREESEQKLLSRSFVRAVLPGSSASTWVIAGLAAMLYVPVPIAVFITYQLTEGTLVRWGLWIGIAGAIGSIISILVRIQDFAEVKILNPPALFWTGFFKPVIGIAFALFVFVLLEAGVVITLAVGEGQKLWTFIALGFVAGFSERFAPDLVSKVEQSIGSGSGR